MNTEIEIRNVPNTEISREQKTKKKTALEGEEEGAIVFRSFWIIRRRFLKRAYKYLYGPGKPNSIVISRSNLLSFSRLAFFFF